MPPTHHHPASAGRRTTGLLAVAPLRHIERVIAETGATHLVSVLNAHLLPPTPPSIDPARHLKLAVSDVVDADGSSRHPLADGLDRLIGFAAAWDGSAPMLVHCFSGLNRSTAAAYILVCALNPDTPETLIAHRLRQASDTAAPNRIMVAVADQMLDRGGKMAAALDLIGPGSPAAEGNPFLLQMRLEAGLAGVETSNLDAPQSIARE
jgi:predicted protein tyrosine phosphatase